MTAPRKDSPMARFKSIAALAAFGATIGACNANYGRPGPAANRSIDSVNQPVVQRTDYVMDIATQGDGLGAVERGRLDAWFQSLGLGYGDRLSIEEPYGPTRSRDDIARIAAEYGLLLSEGAPVTAGTVQPGSVRVIISRSSASVPGCPNWDRPGGLTSTSSNYGCATNSNLAAMVADPADLVLGQAGSGARDPSAGTKAIKVYREAAPSGTKGLEQVNTTGGN